MSIDNTITSLVEAIAANTAALNANTAALLKGAVVPTTPSVVTPEVVEDAPVKADKPKATKTPKPKAEEPKPAPALVEEPVKPAATLPDLTKDIQQALQPILAQKKVPQAKEILSQLGGGASNFACIPREKQEAVLQALQALELS